MRFHSVLVTFETQNHVAVEQFGMENFKLVSGNILSFKDGPVEEFLAIIVR